MISDLDLARREYARARKLSDDPEDRKRIARDNFNEIKRGRRLDAELGAGANVYNETTGRWEWRKA